MSIEQNILLLESEYKKDFLEKKLNWNSIDEEFMKTLLSLFDIKNWMLIPKKSTNIVELIKNFKNRIFNNFEKNNNIEMQLDNRWFIDLFKTNFFRNYYYFLVNHEIWNSRSLELQNRLFGTNLLQSDSDWNTIFHYAVRDDNVDFMYRFIDYRWNSKISWSMNTESTISLLESIVKYSSAEKYVEVLYYLRNYGNLESEWFNLVKVPSKNWKEYYFSDLLSEYWDYVSTWSEPF